MSTQHTEPEWPTHRITPDDFRRWWRETGSASPAPSPEMLLTANAWAQYCLDRWGTPNSAEIGRSLGESADGEVAELATAEMVRQLRTKAATEKSSRYHYSSKLFARAADLLERLSPPQPVPVSERLPGPGDCVINPRTGQGQWCWGWTEHDSMPRSGRVPYSGRWRMIRREWIVGEATHWLPAHAMPVPGEVEG